MNDIYDMIEKKIKEQKMKTKEQWETVSFSKTVIERSAKEWAKTKDPEVLPVINNWRAAHAYPLQKTTEKLSSTFPEYIVVQRVNQLGN